MSKAKVTAHHLSFATRSLGRTEMRIALSMIVRDEAAVIQRCLESIKPWITHWAVVDTGSTDTTRELVCRSLEALPGELVNEKWTNSFAFHRNQALRLAKVMLGREGGAILFVDADETLEGDLATTFTETPHCASTLFEWWVHDRGYRFKKIAIVGSDIAKQWIGERHEYLEHDPTQNRFLIREAWLKYGHDGYRRRSAGTTVEDLRLMNARLDHKSNARDAYYIARTLESRNQLADAAAAYKKVLKERSLTDDERWQAKWGLARALSNDASAAHEATEMYLDLHIRQPERAEPLVFLASRALELGDAEKCFALAQAAYSAPDPGEETTMFDQGARAWYAPILMAESSLMLTSLQRKAALRALSCATKEVEIEEHVRKDVQFLRSRLVALESSGH
jgi:hypothetical protein